MNKTRLITAMGSISLVFLISHTSATEYTELEPVKPGISTEEVIQAETQQKESQQEEIHRTQEKSQNLLEGETESSKVTRGEVIEEIETVKKPEMTQIIPVTPKINKKENKQRRGAKLYQNKGCHACHGSDAKTPLLPNYPKLAGQNKEYIIIQIKDFQAGVRNNAQSGVMRGGMSTIIGREEQLRSIAEWLGSLDTPDHPLNNQEKTTDELALIAQGAKLFKQKNCNTCHGNDAKTPLLPEYPKIAGQNKGYTMVQMKDIKDGKRNNGNSATMQGIMYDITDQEIESIAEWLNSLK